MSDLSYIYQICARCKGSGTEDRYEIVDEEEVLLEGQTCFKCNGSGTRVMAGLSDDLIDRLNDMHDKINCIFEKVNE